MPTKERIETKKFPFDLTPAKDQATLNEVYRSIVVQKKPAEKQPRKGSSKKLKLSRRITAGRLIMVVRC